MKRQALFVRQQKERTTLSSPKNKSGRCPCPDTELSNDVSDRPAPHLHHLYRMPSKEDSSANAINCWRYDGED